MVKSMTGYGRGEYSDDNRKITVEMKAVNHRFLDPGIKMPKKLGMFESQIRSVLKEYATRGKIDIYISYEEFSDAENNVRYNESVAKEYLSHLKAMAENLGIENDIRVSHLSRFPEVFSMEEPELDEEVIWNSLETAFRKACEQFRDSRIVEGENLKTDLLGKLDIMRECVGRIEERAPMIVTEYRRKLKEKVEALLGDVQIEESRIVTEVTIFADKVAVDEELVRLKSHIDTMTSILNKGGEVGKKLDFIAQEMNREANTTLSKANDLALSDTAIELKTVIEKIREQIQNLE